MSFKFVFLLLFFLLEVNQIGELNVCFGSEFVVVVEVGLDGLYFLEVELGEGVPQVVGQIVAKLFVEFGPHEKDLLIFLEVILDY